MSLDGSGTGNIEKAVRGSDDECRDACSVNDECQGYDFNTDNMECWLDTFLGPSNPAIENQYFCSKLCEIFYRTFFCFQYFVTFSVPRDWTLCPGEPPGSHVCVDCRVCQG